MSRSVFAALLGAVLLLAAVGCSTSSSSDSAATPTLTPAPAQPSGRQDLSQAETTTPAPLVMPFAQYFSVARQADTAAIDAWYTEQGDTYRQQQTQIATCMAAAGFQWPAAGDGQAAKPATDIPTGTTLDIPNLPATAADTAVYGYGVWDPDADAQATPDSDALNTYIDSLGAAGAQAFYQALFDDPGCGKSLATPDYESDSSWYTEPVQAMQAAFVGDKDGGGSQSLMADSDMQALNAAWGACMTSAGALQADDWRLDPDLPGPTNAFDVAVLTGPDGSRAPAAGQNDHDHSTLIGSAPEIAIAVADYACRAQTDYVSRFAAIQVGFETRWVSAHKTMLDQMMTTWEQQEHK